MTRRLAWKGPDCHEALLAPKSLVAYHRLRGSRKKACTRAETCSVPNLTTFGRLNPTVREPEVVDALRLTSEQRERIRAIEEEVLIGQLREMRSGITPAEGVKTRGPKGPSAWERILAVLTPDQSQRWRELVGEPIRGPLRAFPTSFGSPRVPSRPPG
jgi:hypothetical protein